VVSLTQPLIPRVVFAPAGGVASRGQSEVCMPQQRKVILIVEKSPRERYELPAMEASLAQRVKQAIDRAIGGKIVEVLLEDADD
jgi:hypothetical protein